MKKLFARDVPDRSGLDVCCGMWPHLLERVCAYQAAPKNKIS